LRTVIPTRSASSSTVIGCPLRVIGSSCITVTDISVTVGQRGSMHPVRRLIVDDLVGQLEEKKA